MTEAERLLSEPSRQSPFAVIFLAWRVVRQISIVNIVVVVALLSSGRLPISGSALIFFGLVGLAVAGGLRWWRFVFAIEDGELRVTRGVLSEERLAIPLNRVQTVSLQQGLLHQVLNLTRVSVDTAGSSEAEFTFDALERIRAEALQQVVAEHRAATKDATVDDATRSESPIGPGLAPPTGPALSTVPPSAVTAAPVVANVVARRGFGDLFKIGLSSWPWAGLVVIVPLIAALDELRELIGVDVIDDLSERLDDVNGAESGLDRSVGLLIGGVLGLILLVTVLGWILQIVRAVITNWELTLTHSTSAAGDTLRRDAGLFNRTSLVANLSRVQSVKSDRLPMHRWLGIRQMVLPITGESDLHLPGATDAEYEEIKGLVFAGDDPTLDRRVSSDLIYWEVRNQLMMLVPLIVVLAAVFGWWGLPVLILAIIGALTSWTDWRRLRWGLTGDRIGYRRGWVVHRTHDVEFIKAQTVQVHQSRFQRRRGLATFRLRTAEEAFEIPMITEAEGRALRDLVLHRVETASRSWM